MENIKSVTFYKAISGYWIAQFPIKGESKLRRQACGDLEKAIIRYQKKGYQINVIRNYWD